MTVIARRNTPDQFSADGSIRPILSPREKAAVIVRCLTAEGIELPISILDDETQTLLAGQMAQMQTIDRETLYEIIGEFCNEIESVGLTFPDGLDKTLELLDGQLSTTASGRLRRMISNSDMGDPWQRIAGLGADVLAQTLNDESVEVGAVVLSKLPVERAAELLGKISGEKARAIAYAVSLTASTSPEVVRRIGAVLLQQLDAVPARAFADEPVARVGAILNQSTASVRDSVLEGLEQQDRVFADEVKKSIFTFALIPNRIESRDVAKILRAVDQANLVTALACAISDADVAARDFILANISQRMADSLREQMAERGAVKEKDADAAQSGIVAAIRQLEEAGELAFTTGSD